MSSRKKLWNRFLLDAKNAKTTRLAGHRIREMIRDYPVFCNVNPENVKVVTVSEPADHKGEFHRQYRETWAGKDY